MAMDLSAASAILKNVYIEPWAEAVNQSTILLDKCAKRSATWTEAGYQNITAIHVGRNVGVGARPEGAALPSPGNQQWNSLTYTCRYLYVTIRLSGQSIEATTTNKKAFIRALENEMKYAGKDARKFQNRMMWHDGSGILCTVTGANTTVTIPVSNSKFIEKNQVIDVRDLTDGSSKGVRTVVSKTATTVVVDSAPTTTDNGDVLILSGTRGTSGTWPVHYDMWGLEALCNSADITTYGITDTIGGKAKSGNDWHQAQMLTNGGTQRDLTLDLLQQAFDLSDIANGIRPGLILTSHAIRRKYANQLTASKRFTAEEKTLDGGWRAMEYNEVPFVVDPDASLTGNPGSLNRLYFLSLDDLIVITGKDWGWLDKDGSVLHLCTGTTSGYTGPLDAYEAVLRCYREFGTDVANNNVVLTDVKES